MSAIRIIQPLTIFSHCVAIYYFGVGCSISAALTNTAGVEVLYQYRKGGGIGGETGITLLRHMSMTTGVGMLVGALLCLVFAIILCVKHKRPWLNPLISLSILIVAFSTIEQLKFIVSKPLWLLTNYLNLGAVPSYVVTGLLWTSVGLLFLFLPFLFKKKEKVETAFQFEQNEPYTIERNHVVNDIYSSN